METYVNNFDAVHSAIDDKNLYEAPYFNAYYVNDPKRDMMYLQERNRILEYFPQGGTILDVGCGVGGFLSIFDDRWTKFGIEPSDFAKDKAVKKSITMLSSLAVADFEQFDVVVFRGTLQHINFPMEYLVQAHRVLKRGGLFVVLATPDADSVVYKLFGRLPALDAPRNWILFGSKFLSNILKRLGYDQIKVLHPYLETPYARPLSDIAKFIVSLFFGWRPFAWPGNQFEMYAVKR